jgi:hypothetical protein
MLRLCLLLCLFGLPADRAEAASVRGTAILDLDFNEKSGPAVDTAPGGQADNFGSLVAGARRVPSPFSNTAGGRAILFDSGRKQFIQIPSSPDTSRKNAVSVSLLVVNFQAAGDGAWHGLFAKRSTDKTGHANYGMNFRPKSDMLQLYVNDGSGFRGVWYSVKGVLGVRQRVHLVASLSVGDAPAADKDTAADDVRVRLFVNGQPATRVGKPDRDLVQGTDVWLLDVKTAGLTNSAPLTIGASTPTQEHFSGVVDEFQLFDRELTAAEAAGLFSEVAGADAGKRFASDRQPAAALPAAPQISAVSLRGLQIGQTTRLVLTGKNLAPNPLLLAPVPGLQAKVVKGSNAGQLTIDITLPDNAPAGLFPIRVATAGGLSNPLTLAVDRLPQRAVAAASSKTPSQLPVALSGLISGPQIARGFIQAKKGQRLVADVESRRLGASCEPVVEIKNAQGTPLAIEWSKVTLKGDTRAEVTVPADGIYAVEVHDLSYKAPGNSHFRVKIGDLVLVDTVFPPAAIAGSEIRVTPVGTGLPNGTTLPVDLRKSGSLTGALVGTPKLAGLLGPAPVLRITRGTEVVEPNKPGTAIDSRFSATLKAPLTISGRISKPGETDRFSLNVNPGQKLRLDVVGRAIDSPIDGELTVLVDGKPVATSQDQAGSRDPRLDFTVPEKVTRIEVTVADLYGRGGSHFLYRLQSSPIGQPNFSLALQTSQLNLPRVGSAMIKLQVNRAGYNGEIALSVVGDKQVQLTPSSIAAGVAGVVSITVTRSSGGDDNALRSLSLVGESVGTKPILRRNARVAGQSIPGHEDLLPVGLTRPSGAALEIVSTPVAIYRGQSARITVAARGLAPKNRTGQAVRIASLSNEPLRPIDPKNRGKGNRPIVRAMPNQAATIDGPPASITLTVPADVPSAAIEFVLRGDLLTHGYATAVQGRVFSRPFRIPVRNAVTVSFDPKTTTLASNIVNNVSGTVKRDPGFSGPVELEIIIDKKLSGFVGGKTVVPAGKTTFTIAIAAGQDNEARVLPGVQLAVRAVGGGSLLPNRPIQLRSLPPKPAAKKKK